MLLLKKSLLLKREAQLERFLDVLIHIQLQNSIRYLAQGKTQDALHTCRGILKVKSIPLAQALQGFIAQQV